MFNCRSRFEVGNHEIIIITLTGVVKRKSTFCFVLFTCILSSEWKSKRQIFSTRVNIEMSHLVDSAAIHSFLFFLHVFKSIHKIAKRVSLKYGNERIYVYIHTCVFSLWELWKVTRRSNRHQVLCRKIVVYRTNWLDHWFLL